MLQSTFTVFIYVFGICARDSNTRVVHTKDGTLWEKRRSKRKKKYAYTFTHLHKEKYTLTVCRERQVAMAILFLGIDKHLYIHNANKIVNICR